MHYVYILQSIKDKKFYIGCTSLVPDERLKKHNAGSVKSTKSRRPFKLIYFETFSGKLDAYKREFYLKSPQGYSEKREIINGCIAQLVRAQS